MVASIDVDQASADVFCRRHGIGRAFGNLGDALAWGDFDAVANVTPDSPHYATTLEIARAGGISSARSRCHDLCRSGRDDEGGLRRPAHRNGQPDISKLPSLQKARELVTSGAIGDVRHVEASYLQSWLAAKYWGDWRTESRWLWRLSKHGSNGVLGDIGIHILDFASYGAASAIENVTCRLKAFRKAPNDQIDDYTLDANDSVVMAVEFANGALGTIHASRWGTATI